MHLQWMLLGFVMGLAAISASSSEPTITQVTTITTWISGYFGDEASPTIFFSDLEASPELFKRREGKNGGGGGGGGGRNADKAEGGSGGGGAEGGHKKLKPQVANKAAVTTGTSAFPKGRWSSTKYCFHKTGTLGNTFATLCAQPGKSPTNVNGTPKQSPPDATPKPKQTTLTSCHWQTMANGITSKVCDHEIVSIRKGGHGGQRGWPGTGWKTPAEA